MIKILFKSLQKTHILILRGTKIIIIKSSRIHNISFRNKNARFGDDGKKKDFYS